jgi:hypothetical protein
MKEIFEAAEKKGLKVVFGLEAQGHIPTIEAELKRRNENFDNNYPEHKGKNVMTYSRHVWEKIGKKIGWCPFTAALSYFEYLNEKHKGS